MSRLTGKVAFVTGAGGGIGRSICDRFLEEGARVAAIDINRDMAFAAVATGDSDAIALRCDVGDVDSVRSAVASTVAAFGKLDVVCNVAGGSTPEDGPVTEASEEEFWRTIRLDLFGTFLCCKHGLPELMRTGGGSVINMSSMVALTAVPGLDCYTAAKGGISAITRSMAVEYAPHRIRVNAIAPGIVLTPRVISMMETSVATRKLLETHLLGAAEPVDVAHMAVYLASDESRRVTGQILAVDSGATL